MRHKTVPNPKRIPADKKIGKKTMESLIQEIEWCARALKKTTKRPHKISTGKAIQNFIFEKEWLSARLKQLSKSLKCIKPLLLNIQKSSLFTS